MRRLFPLLYLAVVTHTYALEDTPENRAKEAARFLAAANTEETLQTLIDSLEKRLPEPQRAYAVKALKENLDVAAYREALLQSAIKTYTAAELKALADFHSSPEGKSAMEKKNAFSAEIKSTAIPLVIQAIEKAKATTPTPAATP